MTSNYQFLPPLSSNDYEALKADIAERGIMVPIEYDQDGNVLDGHHRLRICEELGLSEWPRITRTFASEHDKRTHARQLNLARRHLNQEQRRALIADELRDRPERSNNQIAQALGVSDTTVGAVRSHLEATSQIGKLETTMGADGKARPAKRAPKIVGLDFGDGGVRAMTMAANDIRAKERETRRAKRLQRLIEASAGSAPLPQDRTYPIILADPPWSYERDAFGCWTFDVEEHYPTMELEDICALPVIELAARDALLFLWSPTPMLEQAMAVIRAWGFVYRTGLVWIKQRTGTGRYLRQRHEHLLLARRGEFPTPAPANRPELGDRSPASGAFPQAR